jgi:hypothetical protein
MLAQQSFVFVKSLEQSLEYAPRKYISLLINIGRFQRSKNLTSWCTQNPENVLSLFPPYFTISNGSFIEDRRSMATKDWLARAALDDNLMLTRHVIALQIAVESHQRALDLTHGNSEARSWPYRHLPRTEDPEYRLNLIRDILIAGTTFQALSLRTNDLFAA